MKRKGIKMKTTRETADKVIDEISKVSSDFDFLCCAVAPLKTEIVLMKWMIITGVPAIV